MIELKAIRPLSGSYGKVNPGQRFFAAPGQAKNLIERGLAEKVAAPAQDRQAADPRNKKAPEPRSKDAAGPLAGSRTGGGERS